MGKVMLLLGMGHCCAPSPPRPRSAAGTAVDWLESVGLSALVDKSRSLDAVLRRRAAMFACRGVRDRQHGEIDWSTPPNKDGAPMEPGCKSSSGI